MDKSCMDCPSRVPADETATLLGQYVEFPVCARHGHALGKPGITEKQELAIARKFAEHCDEYSQAKPALNAATRITSRVVMPNEDAVREAMRSAGSVSRPSTCVQCRHFVPYGLVYDNAGWPLPICAMQGRLLVKNKFAQEASACGVGEVGIQALTWPDLPSAPIYAAALGESAGVGGTFDFSKVVPDPQDYVTDRELTEVDREDGIRAWRLVEDQNEYGEPVFLPIFNPEHFDGRERAKIPMAGDDERPEWYVDSQNLVYSLALEWNALDETPALLGHAGVGKTELARHLAFLMSLPFDRINFTSTTQIDDVIGTWLFVGNETVWKNGRIPERWTKAGVLLSDEPNTAQNAIWEMYRPMNDNSKQFVLDSAAVPIKDENGEIVRDEYGAPVLRTPPPFKRHPYFYPCLAMNPDWDSRYVGTNPLSGADRDRLAPIWVDLPEESIEREILTRRYMDDTDGKKPPREILDAVMRIAKELRALANEGTLPLSWGIRPQIAVIRKSRFYPLPMAYARAAADHYEPTTRQLIQDVVARHAT